MRFSMRLLASVVALQLLAQTSIPNTQQVDRTDCSPARPYAHSEHIAHFAVTPSGSILQYPSRGVDEDDIVIVHIFGRDNELQDLKARRRLPGQLAIFGGGLKIEALAIQPCRERTVQVGDFPPGEATIDIYIERGGSESVRGYFTFRVRSLGSSQHNLQRQNEPPKNFSEAVIRVFWSSYLGRVVLLLIVLGVAALAVWQTLPEATKILLLQNHIWRQTKQTEQGPVDRAEDPDKTA